MKNKSDIIFVIITIIFICIVSYFIYAKVLVEPDDNITHNETEQDDINIIFAAIQEKMPVMLSYVYQQEGAYTYCGNSENSDITNGEYYYRVSTQFNNLEELKGYLLTIMTEEMFNKYFRTGEKSYIEQDGKLYCAYMGAGGFAPTLYNIKNIKELADLNYVMTHKQDSSFFSTMTFTYKSGYEDDAEDVKEEFNSFFVKNNDAWLISSCTEK